jgi:guanylate kinase
LITPEDPIALTIVDNDEYIFSDAFTYNDLRDEGLYLEIQRFSDNNWTTLETSKTIFK